MEFDHYRPVVGWNSVTVPAGDVIINDGSFYVAWYTSPGSTAVFGVDTSSTPGISRRSWEAAGGWAENRLLNEADVMLRATIRTPGQESSARNHRRTTPTTLDTVIFQHDCEFRGGCRRSGRPDVDISGSTMATRSAPTAQPTATVSSR
ncbi:MAG: hypothetical protein IPP40_13500 [bacterium]|nr:hypothetical protein [bacterium]